MRRILPLIAATLLFAACDDPTDVEEHAEVEGVALYEGTAEIYRYMLDDGAAPGLTLSPGARDVVIVPLDGAGSALEEQEGDEEHVLEVNIADPTVLTWTAEAGGGAHEFVEFHGELNALQEGSTTMELCVPHGDHCDFDVDIPVTVAAPATTG